MGKNHGTQQCKKERDVYLVSRCYIYNEDEANHKAPLITLHKLRSYGICYIAFLGCPGSWPTISEYQNCSILLEMQGGGEKEDESLESSPLLSFLGSPETAEKRRQGGLALEGESIRILKWK